DNFSDVARSSTSDFSNAIQVSVAGCNPSAPQLLAPQPDEQFSREATFRWTPVEGATAYRIWTMKPGDLPRISFEGTATEATLALSAARTEWWVEALFGNCIGAQTEHRFVKLSAAPAAE